MARRAMPSVAEVAHTLRAACASCVCQPDRYVFPRMRRVLLLLGLCMLASCKAGGCVANVLGDIVGATGDAHCDRRFTAKPIKSSFCQEIVDTIADGEFMDDCDDKHQAWTDEGLCPRDKIIAGCKLHTDHDDGSEVWDWYYDVSDLEAQGDVFEDPPRTKEDVRKLCEDPKRYDQGATYQEL